MNYVFAKLTAKGRKAMEERKKLRKLYSGDECLYDNLFVENSREYTTDSMLEDGEWYKIPEFSKELFCPDMLKQEFRTTDFPESERCNVEEIEYLCAYQSGWYCFQRVFKKNVLRVKTLTLGERAIIEKPQNRITIHEIPDALYSKAEDTLYFKDLQKISPIFDGIISIYKEATEEDVKEFFQQAFITVAEGYSVSKVGTMNRKRLAAAIDALSKLDKRSKSRIMSYTQKYCPQLKYDKDQKSFCIGNEEDLKLLLWGINERFYTTPVTHENRVANSTLKIG